VSAFFFLLHCFSSHSFSIGIVPFIVVCSGVIYMFTPDRVWVRKNDGEKFCLQMQALQSRKHTMRIAQGREL
jgi:hypothetical protein